MEKRQIVLPKGFSINERAPNFKDGENILNNYCTYCMKKQGCSMKQNLQHAMGDDFPYWPEQFIFIKPENDGSKAPFEFDLDEKVICTSYKDLF